MHHGILLLAGAEPVKAKSVPSAPLNRQQHLRSIEHRHQRAALREGRIEERGDTA